MFSILKLTSDQTIGPGEPGAKSAALRQHKNLVETLNLADNGTYPYSQLKYIPQVALTPESFSPFFSRAGASIEKPEESQKAIQKTSFNKAEMDALKLSLSYYGNEYIAIRSDEQTASGVGLWETRFMWTKNPSRSFSAYARKVKEVLASDYSENVIAFKKRTGISLDRPVGVFLMNLSGSLFQCDIGPGVGITTPIHANIITSYSNGFPIAAMGNGIGGANDDNVRTYSLEEQPYVLARAMTRHFSKFDISSLNILVGDSIQSFYGLKDDGAKFDINPIIAQIERESESIAEGMARIVFLIQSMQNIPKYVELAFDSSWSLVQIADCNLGHVKRPDIGKSNIVFQTSRDKLSSLAKFGAGVSGRRVFSTDQVFYLKDPRDLTKFEDFKQLISNLSELNKTSKDYVVITNTSPVSFRYFMPFSKYSNAGAFIIQHDFTGAECLAASHLSGAAREAGIAVIMTDDNPSKFVDSLKPGLNNRKVLVYANDEKEEGFLASSD